MSFHDTMNPSGAVPVKRVMDQPIPEQHLLERILSQQNMVLAWKRVRANQGAAGVDGIAIGDFPDRFRPLWAEIRASLNAGNYHSDHGFELVKELWAKNPLPAMARILCERPAADPHVELWVVLGEKNPRLPDPAS